MAEARGLGTNCEQRAAPIVPTSLFILRPKGLLCVEGRNLKPEPKFVVELLALGRGVVDKAALEAGEVDGDLGSVNDDPFWGDLIGENRKM